ncbi:MAG: hypothetical protein ACREPE_09120 [Lysobacter sp.]
MALAGRWQSGIPFQWKAPLASGSFMQQDRLMHSVPSRTRLAPTAIRGAVGVCSYRLDNNRNNNVSLPQADD